MIPNIFRVARDASPAWNLAKTFAQMLVLWCLFLFLGPWLITTAERGLGIGAIALPAQRVVAFVLFAVASTGAVWSASTMAAIGGGTPLPLDCARRLVVAGPYRYIRNPMAVVAVAQAGAVGIWFGSWLVLLYAFAGGAVWNWILRPAEERDLVARFGEPYARYRDAVPCWRVRLQGYDAEDAGPGDVAELSDQRNTI